jgi:hypothetical protein
LTQQNEEDEDPPRRFDIELFVVHPTLTPAEITGALGIEPNIAHQADERRKTPKGSLLPGNYRDTRWRYRVRHEVRNQRFAEHVTALIDRLMPHKDFLGKLRSTGGTASMAVQFLGDGYFGDEIPRDVLVKLLQLELDFAIECFSVPQS